MREITILLAQEASILAITSAVLSRYHVIAVASLLQAQVEIMRQGIDLFVIGIHFDDSHALELIRSIRETSHYSRSPIILIRTLPSPLVRSVRKSVEALRTVYDISMYLELEESADPDEDLKEAVAREVSKLSLNA